MPETPKIKKLFRKTQFGVFSLFGFIALSMSALCIYTVNTELSEEYVSNSQGIAKTIADSSVNLLLNGNLASLQSLVDQFVEIQGINYIYITNENGDFLVHTFVPGIPLEVRVADPMNIEAVERSLPGIGDFVEVGAPILAGVAGTVHIGMDTSLIALKIQRAVGQQIYLISGIFLAGVFSAIWLVNLAAKPLAALLAYAVDLAKRGEAEAGEPALLERNDEVGHLARIFLYMARTDGGRASLPADG